MAPPLPDLDRYRSDAGRYLEAPGAADDATLDALFSAEAVAGLESSGGGDRRRIRALARFAAEGHLRRASASEMDAVQRLVREPLVGAGPERVTLLEVDGLLAAEPDAARRRELQAARLRAIDSHLAGLLADAALRRAEAARALGAGSAAELVARAAGIGLDRAAADAEHLLAATDDIAARALDGLARGLGVAAARLDAADVPRLVRAPHLEEDLPSRGVAAAVARTREALGGAPAPLPVPGLTGVAGAARALLGAGAALAREGVSPRLPVEARRLGDPALVQAHAHLLESLASDPEWLRRALGAADPDPIADAAAAVRLLAARAAAAGAPAPGPGGSADAMSRALGLSWPAELAATAGLGDLAPVHELRGRMLAAALRAHLRDAYGARWFAEAAAARFLRELWLEGGDLDAETLARELGQPGLDPGLVAAEAAERLG